MKASAGERLSPALLEYLQSQHPFVIITLGEDGWPCAEMLSWILAVDEHTIRLAIGSQKDPVANIRRNGHTTLQILGPRLAFEIKGFARVIKERCDSVRFPQTMVELKVDSIRENMYPANFITGDVPVDWPEGTKSHHDLWNEAIAEEMRTAFIGQDQKG